MHAIKIKLLKIEIPVIKTHRLLLREILDADINNVYKGLSHPMVIKHYGVNFTSLEATKEQMEWFKKPEQYWFAIFDLDGEIFYGAAGLNDVTTDHKKGEIGLWLLPDFWGQGIMKEVMPLICQFGFDILGLHRIEGFIDSENRNCKRAMSKLDFEYEGTMRDCEIKDNKYISVDIYAKLHEG